jgi:hypothetical protein
MKRLILAAMAMLSGGSAKAADEFTWLNKQGVRSQKGFEFQFTGRFSAQYREGSKVISMSVEPGYTADGKVSVTVSPEEFTKWDGDARQIASEERARIEANVRRALQFQKLELTVESPLTQSAQLRRDKDLYLGIVQAGKQLKFGDREIKSEADYDQYIKDLEAAGK